MRLGSRSSEVFKNELRTEAEFVAAYAGACCGIGNQRASSKILRSRLAFLSMSEKTGLPFEIIYKEWRSMLQKPFLSPPLNN